MIAGQSIVPLAILAGMALVAILVGALLWRRKGKTIARPALVLAEPDADLLRRWASLGEYRAALHHWGWRLAHRIKQSSDFDEIAALQRTLEEIGDRTFVREHPERLAVLAGQASDLDRE